jgi:hypothetical protein
MKKPAIGWFFFGQINVDSIVIIAKTSYLKQQVAFLSGC